MRTVNKTLSANTTLSHYRIVSKIGAGGMGEVYLAEDTQLERLVALKVLLAEIADDEDRVRRFVQEAKAASALNHPNILTVHEIGHFENLRFIATELIKGQTLRDRLRGEPLSLRKTLDIALQVAAALNAAHQAGIVHRDIKPENIMLRDDGLVKVLDFGLAKLTEMKSEPASPEDVTRVHIKTSPGLVMGTAAYMSPEQARGKEIDSRSDIWSLGAVIYEMLTRRIAFAGETTSDSVAAILTTDPAPLDANTPLELQRIVKKTLQRKADERYQTIKDLQVDINTLKRELEFSEELERSQIPGSAKSANVSVSHLSEHATANNRAAISAQNSLPQQTSSAEYLVSQISGHKRGVAAGLIILLATIGLTFWLFSDRKAPAKQIESIAVMPFVNESGNADVEYLSDGMTETLITSLSQLPNLNVKARSSVFRYKGKEIDLQRIAQELKVQAILTGRVAQRGDQLMLSLELVDTRTENAIWSEQYNRRQTDLVSLQSEIARDVSSKLRLKLSGADQQKLAKTYTGNPEAYQLYLKGRFHWNKRTDEGFKQANNFFQEAIVKDPNYALAYTGLADCYILRSDYGLLAPAEGYALAKGAVTLALKYDESLAEAHTSLASIKAVTDWDWQGAENEYRRAIELNPNYPTAHHWYAIQLMLQGRLGQAVEEITKAQQLDPLSLGINKDFAVVLLYARDYDKALEQCRKTLEIEPHLDMMFTYIAQIYELRKQYPEATAELEKPHAAAPEDVEITYALGQAYALMGKKDQALKISNKLNQPAKQNTALPKEAAYLYSLLGEHDKAVAILQKAKENHYPSVAEINADPRLTELRKDARVVKLLQEIGLSQ